MFTVIDSIVTAYPSYQHDEVFQMETAFVIDLDIMGRKKAFVQAKQSEERQKKINEKEI